MLLEKISSGRGGGHVVPGVDFIFLLLTGKPVATACRRGGGGGGGGRTWYQVLILFYLCGRGKLTAS